MKIKNQNKILFMLLAKIFVRIKTKKNIRKEKKNYLNKEKLKTRTMLLKIKCLLSYIHKTPNF